MRTLRAVGVLALTAAAFVAQPALAHIRLDMPKSRNPTTLKDPPCGAVANTRSLIPTWFKPGTEVTVGWTETIDHPGHYRIMLQMDGSTFADPASFTDTCDPMASSDPQCIVDDIADKSGGSYEYTFTLPNVECDNCTIQVIQVMTDKPPYGDGNDIYHQCADIVISTMDPPVMMSTTSAVTSAGSGTPSTTSSGSGGAGGGGTDGSDGCSVATNAAPSSGGAIALLGLLLAGASRRRPRAPR